MKNKVLIIILGLICTAFFAQAQFSNTYGDNANNNVNRLKRRGDFIYLAGTRTDANGLPHATFSRIEAATGNITWTTVLDSVTVPLDFEFIETDPDLDPSGFYMVGYTGNFLTGNGPQPDNESFLCRLDASGNVDWVRIFDLPARRESFNRIIRVLPPGSLAVNYYISGTINNNDTIPDRWDWGRLLRMDVNGNINDWGAYYQTDNETMDNEFGARLISWGNDQLLLGGNYVDNNPPPNRYGLVYTVGLPGGNVINAVRFGNNNMVTDVLRWPGSGPLRLIVAGFNNNNSESFIAGLDANLQTLWTEEIDEFQRLDHLGRDNAGRLFASGRHPATSRNALCRFNINAAGISSGTIYDINPVSGDILNGAPHIWVRGGSVIHYADSRVKGNGLGFQGQDIHLAVYDNLLDGYECDTTFAISLDSINYPTIPYDITRVTLADSFVPIGNGGPIVYQVESDGCGTVSNDNCCEQIQVLPTQEACNGSRLVFNQLPPNCTVETVTMSISGGATIASVQAFYGMGCGTESFTPGTNTFTFYPQCPTNQLVSQLNIPPGGPVILTYEIHFVGSSEVCVKSDTIDCCCPVLEVNTQPTGQVFVSQFLNCLNPNWQIEVQITNGTFVGGSISGGGGCLSPGNLTAGTSTQIINVSCAFVPNFSFFIQPTNPNLPTEITVTSIENGSACSSSTQSLLFCETVCNTDVDFTPAETCPEDIFSHMSLNVSNQSSINSTICGVTITASDVNFGDWAQGNAALSGTSIQTANSSSILFVPLSGTFTPGQTANFWLTFPANPEYSGTITVQVDYCNSEACDTSFVWNPSGGVGPGEDNGNLHVDGVTNGSYPLHWAKFTLEKAIPPVGPKKVKAIGVNLVESANSEIIGVTNVESDCGGSNSLKLSVAQHDTKHARFVLEKELRAEDLSGQTLSVVYSGNKPEKVHVVFYDAYGSAIHQSTLPLSSVVTGSQNPEYAPIQMAGFPNPATRQFTVEYYLAQPDDLIFEIQNQLGQTVRSITQSDIPVGKNQTVLPVHDLPAGIYFVKTTFKQGFAHKTIKMVISR